MANIVLIREGNANYASDIEESLKPLGHKVVNVNVNDIADISKDNYALVILFVSSRKNVSSAVSAVRSEHMLRYTPFIIVDRGKVFSGAAEDEMIDFLSKYSVDDIIRSTSEKLSAYRISKYIHRLEVNQDLNPLTGLPGNMIINRIITRKMLDSKDGYSVVYSDVNDFKAYNDTYGFHAGDMVIKRTADTLQNALSHPEDAFLGHIGGDDFVMVMPTGDVEKVVKKVIRNFEKGVKEFYQPLDYERGGIISIDREGRRQKFDLISLSLVSFSNRKGMFNSVNEIAEYAGALKHIAKKNSKTRKKSFHLKGSETSMRSRSFSLLNLACDAGVSVGYRKAAIEAMGEIQEKQHEETLFVLLDKDLPYQLKKSCIYALGKLRSMKAVKRLMEFINDPNPHLRSRAVEALANIGTTQAVPVLIKALRDRNIHTRRMAALTLGRLGDARAIGELIRILQSKDPELKRNAIVSIGELGDPDTAELVLNMLDNQDIIIKKEAIRALGRIHSVKAVGKFLEMMKKEDAEIRDRIASVLFEILTNCSINDVSKYFSEIVECSRDPAPSVRGVFMDILGLIPDEGAKTRLKECLKDRSGYVRWHATFALSGKKGREIVFLIMKRLRDNNDQVRIAAARSLGRMGNLNALEALRIALKDTSYRVSQEAAEAIIGILRSVRKS